MLAKQSVFAWLLIVSLGNIMAQQYTVHTVAGGGANTGTSGSPGWATGGTSDASGNVFLAISDASVVVRVYATTRALSVVAGNGTAGYSGDGPR
jgi:hypothetical protein